MTLESIVTGEGRRIRAAAKYMKQAVLTANGFTEDGILPEGSELSEHLKNKPLDSILIDPEAIMLEKGITWDPTLAQFKDNEFSAPETGYHPRSKIRRSERLLVPDEEREEVLKTYTKNVNCMTERDPKTWILHPWRVERHIRDVVNIFIDGDLVPEQAATRVAGRKPICRKEQTYIKHINIRIEMDDGNRFNITSTDLDDSFQMLLACLLDNGLTQKYFYFFIDGEKILREAIHKYFAPWHYSIFLDFYHVEEKIDTLLSMAIITKRVDSPWDEHEYYVIGPKKGELKDPKKTSLSVTYSTMCSSIIWYGNIDEAIEYLNRIQPEHIKNAGKRDELIRYFDSRRSMLTCYALRRRSGLKNSSNASELINELLISARQKVDDRMHWRAEGSSDLAALAAMELNKGTENWFRTRSFSFKMYQVSPTAFRKARVNDAEDVAIA